MNNERFSIKSTLKKHTPIEKTPKPNRILTPNAEQKKAKQRQAAIRKQTVISQQQKKKELVHEMYRTLRLHFPELFDWMRKVDDCRKKASNYELAAHLTDCLPGDVPIQSGFPQPIQSAP